MYTHIDLFRVTINVFGVNLIDLIDEKNEIIRKMSRPLEGFCRRSRSFAPKHKSSCAIQKIFTSKKTMLCIKKLRNLQTNLEGEHALKFISDWLDCKQRTNRRNCHKKVRTIVTRKKCSLTMKGEGRFYRWQKRDWFVKQVEKQKNATWQKKYFSMTSPLKDLKRKT